MLRPSGLNKSLAAVLLTTSGCGAAAEAVRPNDPSAAHAMSERSIQASEDADNPLVVDWRQHHRDALELAMKEGVAVVSYDQNELRLLPGCSVSGNYEFKPTTQQESFVRLRNTDEIRASLPTSGQTLGINLEADLKRGATLDITLKTVGRIVTNRSGVSRALLRQDCEKATHIVRAATIGAFTMNTNTLGHVGGGVSAMGTGAGTEAVSEKTMGSSSGNMSACSEPTTDGKPPTQCSTPVRLHLEKIRGSENCSQDQNLADSNSNEGLFIQPNFGYGAVLAPDQTAVHVMNFGAALGYTLKKIPFTFSLGAGGQYSPKGGVASHYSELAKGGDRWDFSVQAGIGVRPKFNDLIGLSAMANGRIISRGGGGAFVDIGPELYFSRNVSIGINGSAGYLHFGEALGGNPTSSRIDPQANGFFCGGNVTGTFNLF